MKMKMKMIMIMMIRTTTMMIIKGEKRKLGLEKLSSFHRHFPHGHAGWAVGRGPQAQAALPGSPSIGGGAAGAYSGPAAPEARA